jgi:hypothetical protein
VQGKEIGILESLKTTSAILLSRKTRERQRIEGSYRQGLEMQDLLDRKCERCGANLTEKDVMKIMKEDGSWDTLPLPLCPKCFTQQMRELAHAQQQKSEPDRDS